jgi:hypothetical protein
MAEQQFWFASKPLYENYGLALASDTEAYTGHVGKATEFVVRAVDSAILADNQESGAIWKANSAVRQAVYGHRTDAERSAEQALKLASRAPTTWSPIIEATACLPRSQERIASPM